MTAMVNQTSTATTSERYNITQSYDWNYENVPHPPDLEIPTVPGDWHFCGIPVASPLGIPAGPLLNSRWIIYYARLGFDVLTYKTVRSGYRACYEPPNLLPVTAENVSGDGAMLTAAPPDSAYGTWAISFGMPSKTPATWQADVETARQGLGPNQVLSVSVVASPEADWTVQQVADDFAQCAKWAVDSGAHVVEANLSCPNVCTKESDLYLDAEASAEIASTIRDRIGKTPLVLKIGLFPNANNADALIRAVSPHADALSSTNSLTAPIRSEDGEPLFGGLRRGIGGAAIAQRCNQELGLLSRLIGDAESPLRLIGVGGVLTADDVRARLTAGAHNVHLATAPMLDPLVGIEIRRALDTPHTP